MKAALAVRSTSRPGTEILIEGYASLFGIEDRARDIVRAGAFSACASTEAMPMLLQHQAGAKIGRWVRIVEDGRGLFVRGLIEAASAKSLVKNGLNGLSIGFRPRVWTLRSGGGRVLSKIDLVEISLVAEPMLPTARFNVISGIAQ